MNGPLTPERALDLLEAQLEELGALRNAHARDPRFKQWRQATLTVIQRIWPGDAARAERFRRVPFSPPSSKMSQKATRSFFEKGCAEAVQLIRSMIPELNATSRRPTRPQLETAPEPGETEDDFFPVVDLPGTAGNRRVDADDDEPEANDIIEIPPAPTPALKSKSEARRNTPPGTRPRDAQPEAPSVPKAPPGAGKVSMRSSGPTSESRPPLREMLGFSSRPLDDDDADDTRGSREHEDVAAYDDDIEATPVHSEWEVDEVDEAEPGAGDPEGWEAPEEFQLPARARGFRDDESDGIIETDPENFPPAGSVVEESEEPVAEDESDAGNVMEEFLRTSPVLGASARPVRRRESEAAAPRSPAATSLVALASEVAQLGVPEGQRAGMRATLIELARRVDERSLDWDTLRESFDAVLDFPPLARRVIPLLIPYLDVAA